MDLGVKRTRRMSRLKSWSSRDSMQQSPSSPINSRCRERDTGFPEPFCGYRNTSLPHPEADLSPNACIWAEDVPIRPVISRTNRRSLLHPRNRRAISRGVITAEMEQMYSDANRFSSGSGSPDSTPDLSRNPSTGLHSSRGGGFGESVADANMHHRPRGDNNSSALISPPPVSPTSTSGSSKKRENFLKKLLHRHK